MKYRWIGAACALLLSAARGALAQPAPQVNQNCTVSVLNRTVTANANGTWILPNVPANFGPVRARVTCIVNGQTIAGESDSFVVPANGIVNIPAIHFGQTTPIPTALTIAQPAPLTQAGQALQLSVTAHYSDGSTKDVTPAAAGTTYTVTNPAFATITSDGLVRAVSSGTVIVQASHEGASGMTSIRVAFGGGNDSDGDGIPDVDEVRLGLNPNDAIDAMEDFDRDNLTNLAEFQLGTDLRNADTDGDALRDGDEVARGTNPLLRDTDGDGVSDGLEVQTGSNPSDASSVNLAGALSRISVTPQVFTITFNTIAGDASVALKTTGTLRDGTTIDLTSPQRGTNYASNNLNVCNFGGEMGRVFAGVSGGCTITVSVAGFATSSIGTVTTFSPTPLSSVPLGGPGMGVDVGGDFVYVAAGATGLKVVDVSNRLAPVVAATVALQGTANDVKLMGTRAYVASGPAGVHVLDISNPRVPRLLGSVDTLGNALDLRPTGNFVFVANGASGLKVIDATNGSAPRLVGGVATGPGATGVDVAGTMAVVTTGNGVRVVDVTNPTVPVVVGALATPGDARDVVVNDGFAFVANYTDSLRAIDFRNPAAPLLAGNTPTALGGILYDVARMDNFVFGADVFFVNGVPIVDVSDAANLRPRAILSFPGDATGLGIAVDGSYVYLGTDTQQLYIGQYRIQQDLNGVPPTVSIASPASGSTFVEGETIPVVVQASDDIGVSNVALLVDGAIAATDTTAPYQFSVTAPTGTGGLLFGATAADLGNNTGTATTIAVNVIQDPLTEARGRVVRGGLPIVGATITCADVSGISVNGGAFLLPSLSTVRPLITCSARFVDVGGVIFGGTSAPTPAVRGGVTAIDDIAIAPVPIVTSITPRIIDADRPPGAIQVTGSNLSGAVFAFAPDIGAITAGAALIEPDGTKATVPVNVSGSARGRFTLYGTNAAGASDPTPTDGNVLTLINSQDEVDTDGDGFPDGFELLFGSDPASASSIPNFSARGDTASLSVSIVNRLFPSTFKEPRQAESLSFALLNQLFPTDAQIVRQAQSLSFALLNKLFPSDVATTRQAESLSFSVVNRLFPQGVVTTRQAESLTFSLVNRLFPENIARDNEIKSYLFSVFNSQTLSQQSLRLSTSQQAVVALDISPAADALVEGQTVVVRALATGETATNVEFRVNGASLGRVSAAPFEWLFTTPAGVAALTFEASVATASNGTLSAPALTVPVIADRGVTISGRVVDESGRPVAGADIALLSEGLDLELFDASSPLTRLPDLTGRTPQRVGRVTAINMRNQARVFGADPLGTRLLPDVVGRMTGWLTVTTPGRHKFMLGASEPARLIVSGTTVAQIQSATGEYQERQGAIDLPMGLARFEVQYLQGVGPGDLHVSFAPPSGTLRTIPPAALVPAARVLRATSGPDGRFSLPGVPSALGSVQVQAVSAGRRGTSPVLVPSPRTDIDISDLRVAP